jgi:hypothetical protein
MTFRGLAFACALALGLSMASACRAGVWSSEPFVGLVGDLSTNPGLLAVSHPAETHAALLVDAPITYSADAVLFSLLPRFRVGDSKGYSSTASDYEHLDAKWEWDTARGSLSSAAGIARDSSLYKDYVLNGTTGVRREAATAERLALDTNADFSRVRYALSRGASSLSDYTYTSVAPTLSWLEAEKNKFTASASAGVYKSSDGTTKSRNGNVQLGFIRSFTELWSFAARAGYSRALDELNFLQTEVVLGPTGFRLVQVPVTAKSSQNRSVFSATLSRQGSRLLLNMTASRQLVPSGFAFLSRERSYEMSANYQLTSRWNVIGDARYLKSEDPSNRGIYTDRTVRIGALSSTWRWTEHWTATAAVTRIAEKVGAPAVKPASTEFSIQLSRQFDRWIF